MRRGVTELVAAAMRPVLEGRGIVADAQNQVDDVKTAFSSWDNCMQAAYCKWPVIAIIVIGGLIIFSIVWCIARCLCCGLSCCCECCYCLKCCGECCGCCSPPRGRRHKYLDEPYIPPNQGYRSEAPMTAGALPAKPSPFPSAAAASAPQYAEFETSKKGGAHEDALPEMPSWEGAGSKKVLVEDEPVELEQLKKPATTELNTQGAQNVPLMAGGHVPGPASPISPDSRSPYGVPGSQSASSGYLGAGAPPAAAGAHDHNDPYGLGDQPYSQNAGGYGQQSQTSFGNDQAYGMAGAAGVAGAGMAGAAMGPGRRSPRVNNGGYGQQPMGQGPMDRGYQNPQDYNNAYGRSQSRGPADQGYGMGPGRRSPPRGPNGSNGPNGPVRPNMMGGAAYPDRERRSPAPQGDRGYGNNYNNRPYPPNPQRQYSSDSTRPLARPPPQRQFTDEYPPPSPTSLQNNSGFDFNSGFSRPPPYSNNSSYERRPSESSRQGNQGIPTSSSGGGQAYPGYKPYQPAQDNTRQQDGWSGL